MESRYVDNQRLDELITTYSDMVYRIAMMRCQSREDAEDVYQEVFIKLVRYAGQLESDEHIKAWLIRVTINQCNSLNTSSWKKKTSSFDDMLENGQEPSEVDEGIERAGEGDEMLQVVRQLKPEYRDVIYLFYYEDYSIRQISDALHETEANVRVRLTRARKKLKSMMEEKGMGPHGGF